MCTNLVRIKNPSRTYRPLVTASYLDVPCGKCPECIQNAQSDWFLRAWSEIDKYNKLGGRVVFVTLTYADWFLPKYTYVQDGTKYNIPCFNKKHKDQFINSIIQHYKRKGLTKDTTGSGLGLKFMWSSEYGMDERFTHRPHYHVLLFFPPEYIDWSSTQKCKDFIQSYWKYGMCRWSKPKDKYGNVLGIFVQREFAGLYVSKYMVKQVEFYDQPAVNQYILNDDGSRNVENYNKIKNFLPRHWQSQGFGIDLINYCQDLSVFHDGLKFDFVKDRIAGKDHFYKVPRYITRKVLYDVDEHGSYVLNELGRKYNRDYVKKILVDVTFRLSKYLDYNYLHGFCMGSDFYEKFSKDYHTYVKNESDVLSLINEKLAGRSVDELVIYNQFFKYRFAHEKDKAFIDNFVDGIGSMDNELSVSSDTLFNLFLDSSLKKEFYEVGFMKNKDFDETNLIYLDNYFDFKDFDLILQMIQDIKHYLSTRRQELYLKDIQDRKKVKFMIG